MEGVGGIDTELSKSGSQVASAVAPTERWVAWFIWVEWCWQWGREVQTGQIRQGTPCIQCRWDMRGTGLLVWRREYTNVEGKRKYRVSQN